MRINNDLQVDDNGRPLVVVSTQTAKSGKEIETEYFCLPKKNLESLGAFLAKNDISGAKEAGFRTAMVLIDWEMKIFGEVPETNWTPPKPRKKILIDGLEYFEDEVIDRIRSLPSTKSIWRNSNGNG